MPILSIGDPAPDFDLPSASGSQVSLSSLRGRRAILFFYPAASTPGCTKQACGLRDNYDVLRGAGYDIYGISPDDLPALQAFIAEQSLPYELLSDPSHAVMEAYGAWGEKNMYGKTVTGTIRSTFAIDEDGSIILAKYRVKTPSHVDMLRKELQIA